MVKIIIKLMALLVIGEEILNKNKDLMKIQVNKGHIFMVTATLASLRSTNSSNVTVLSNIKIEDKIKSLDVTKVATRRKAAKNKRSRSTSSSSGVKDDDSDTSIGVSDDTESGVDSKNKKHVPQSSAERTGWRKWHRKCTPCPEDMKKKWTDRSIEWICGAYQRARRSFKSSCMMYYRNCQDGTMFVKIHEHRCENIAYHGEHFHYDYRVPGSDSSGSDSDISYSDFDSDYR